MQRFIQTLICVPLLTPIAFGHRVMATYADQKDAPLQIVAMVNSQTDLASRIDLRNTSDKTIVEFQIGWLTAAPRGCSDQKNAIKVEFARPEEVNLKPDQQRQSLSYRVGTARTKDMAGLLKSKHVFLQFGVVYVKFEDGSRWQHDLKKMKTFGDDVQLGEFACTREFEQRERETPPEGPEFEIPKKEISLDMSLAAQPSLSAAIGLPDARPRCALCNWRCNPTASFKKCQIYQGSSGTCEQDALNRCCLTFTPPAPTTDYRQCYLACRQEGCPGGICP